MAPLLTGLRSRWPLAVALALALALMAAGQPAFDLLAWNREQIVAGEFWRLLTGHLLHGSHAHALLNVAAGVLLLALPDGGANARQWAFALIATAFAVGVGLLARTWPDVYVGLSGVLHGLVAWLACRCASRTQPGWVAIVALLWLKVVAEQFVGSDLPSSALIGMPVVIDAHLFGAIAGTVIGLMSRRPARAPTSAT